MLEYLLSKRKQAVRFASLSDFMSEYLTPEGFQFFNHVTGWIPDYERQLSARALTDYYRAIAHFKTNFARPHNGLSAITKALKMSATKLGAKLYKNEKIKVIDENHEKQFKLITTNYTIIANKLVVAVPPKTMKQIKGSVAEKIQNDSTFQTIGFAVAFKGFAVFEEAWWQLNSTGSRYLADEQEMQSTSDCLGITFPYKPRGPKGEAVMQISYAKHSCAVKWGELLKISKESVDREMHRALKRLFPGVDIPKPLDSVYAYWDEGFVHMQRAGTHHSMFTVSSWAKRPSVGQDLFIVGEAYQPVRGWIEGALQSAQNALLEGWGIGNKNDEKQKTELTQESAYDHNLDFLSALP